MKLSVSYLLALSFHATLTNDSNVAFRLFSTQKVPQKIVIRETEIWPVVADPRIRSVLSS